MNGSIAKSVRQRIGQSDMPPWVLWCFFGESAVRDYTWHTSHSLHCKPSTGAQSCINDKRHQIQLVCPLRALCFTGEFKCR